MVDVVLVQPKSNSHPFMQSLGFTWPNMALLYLGAVLESYGLIVEIIDMQVDCPTVDEVVKRILNHQPMLVGFTAHSNEYLSAREIARNVKDSIDTKIVIGGPHSTLYWDYILAEADNPFDICVIGEGEQTIIDIIGYLDGILKIDEIPGIAYSSNQLIRSRERKFISDLDSFPFPALHLARDFQSRYGMDRNLGLGKERDFRPFIPIVSSRGCNYNCVFCICSTYRRWRARSPQNVVQEIRNRIQEYGIRNFLFVDDNATADPTRTEEICRLIIDEELSITWHCFSRVDWILQNKNLVKKMRQSGCESIFLGVETTDRLLPYYKKGIRVEQSIEATNILRQLGISVTWGLIIGSLYEKKEDIEKLTRLIENGRPDLFQLFVLTPIRNTELYNDCIKQGVLDDEYDWRKHDCYHSILKRHGEISSEELLTYRDNIYWKYYYNYEWCMHYVERICKENSHRSRNLRIESLKNNIETDFRELFPRSKLRDFFSNVDVHSSKQKGGSCE